MKNRIFKKRYVAAILSLFLMSSCDTILDQDETDFGQGPILAEFVKSSETANFIVDGTVATYDVAIGIVGGDNQPINTPVDITISVDPSSTATSGNEFTLEKTSYTVMPGDLTVNAQLKVNTDNLEPFDPKTVVLRIDSSSKGVSESNKTAIVLQAVCQLDLSGFVGDYKSTTSRTGTTGNATVELGSKPNSLLIINADGRGADEILVILSTDVTKPTITYVEGGEATLYVSATYGNAWATLLTPAKSTYNSCDFSMRLEFKTCVGAGCFAGTTKITLIKQS